jgi:hypothetical protein
MKKFLFLFMAASLLSACSSPVLKWIDTPGEKNAFEDGRTSGQPGYKEIISFSFGIEGERVLPFGGNPDNTGKYPISVILPEGTSITSLTPVVVFIGKSLNPPSRAAGNFTAPVLYTVTAEDGSTRTYVVTVFVKSSASKAIVRFAVVLSPSLTAEGIIDEAAGTITVGVPAGTNTAYLSANITHTGASVRDPWNRSHLDEVFDITGDFSAPCQWTVFAGDSSEKTYTVTVVKEKSDEKDIRAFSLVPGDDAIISGEPQADGKYPILVVVPAGTVLSAYPRLVYHTGVSISPGARMTRDFSRPEIYTVTAEDRSTKDYVVRTIVKDAPGSSKQINGFYFIDPLVEGVIDQQAKTISLWVPSGTDMRNLRPEIYHNGKSVEPASGAPVNFTGPVPYTVRAQDGSFQEYLVSVFESPAPVVVPSGTGGETVSTGTNPDNTYNIIVEFPIHIDQPTININYPGSFETINITNDNIFNTYIRGDDDYNITVINPPAQDPVPSPTPTEVSINAFYFTSPAAIGVIAATGTGTADDPHPITLNVPYGTDLQKLKATVVYTGNEIAGIPGASPLKDSLRSFRDPVDYTVRSGGEVQEGFNTKTYRVTVTVLPNTAKEISDITFTGVNTQALISALPTGEGVYPIVVTVPQGTVITNLTPVITHTGASIKEEPDGADTAVNPFTGTGRDFSASPWNYTVKAEDGSTKTYAVTVRYAEDGEHDAPEITGFYFTSPLAVGTINQEANTITVPVPSGTSRGSLRPSVYFTGLSVSPGSGMAANFNGPVNYTVTGISGVVRSYTVMVNILPSTAKDITRFKFPGHLINTETIIGAVADPDGTYPISVMVPAGTELAGLAPDLSHTGVSISPGADTPRDFNNPQDYTVTAEDGSAKTYRVRVNAMSGGVKMITSFVFTDTPLSGGGTVRVAASIDQDNFTIQALVPYTADITTLKPTLTWIGKSIAAPTGAGTTANPFTDGGAANSGRDFGSPVEYTVWDQNNGSRSYRVTVIRQSPVTVSFEGDVDYTLIAANTFDPVTGIITVIVNDSGGVIPPYEWYVNGVKQAVSGTESPFTFTLNVGDGAFIPGRHEITVSGLKNGLHYTGKVYFVVAGGAL